jgi:TPR repeat protein
MANVGRCFEKAIGTPKIDLEQAAKYYEKAAELGDIEGSRIN